MNEQDSQAVSSPKPSDKSKPKAKPEIKSEHDKHSQAVSSPEQNGVRVTDVEESPIFEIGNLQLGPSQPIISENRQKGSLRSNRFSTSGKLKSPGPSRHAKECLCTECDPNAKKKEKNMADPTKNTGLL